MAILVGLRFDEDSAKQIYDWLLRCHRSDFPLQRPIHPDYLLIPLAHHGGDKMDDFVPRGKMQQIVEFVNPKIQYMGERSTIVMKFSHNDWIVNRIQDLRKLGFNRRGKAHARLPLSIHSPFLDHAWVKTMPRKVMIAEEVVVPFDQAIGKYAHLPKEHNNV